MSSSLPPKFFSHKNLTCVIFKLQNKVEMLGLSGDTCHKSIFVLCFWLG